MTGMVVYLSMNHFPLPIVRGHLDTKRISGCDNMSLTSFSAFSFICCFLSGQSPLQLCSFSQRHSSLQPVMQYQQIPLSMRPIQQECSEDDRSSDKGGLIAAFSFSPRFPSSGSRIQPALTKLRNRERALPGPKQHIPLDSFHLM